MPLVRATAIRGSIVMNWKSLVFNAAKVLVVAALCVYIALPELIHRRPSLFVGLVIVGMVIGGISFWQAAKLIASRSADRKSESGLN